MARPLRIQYENAFYHVTCRGNAQETIFSDDQDRKNFLRLLARSAEIYQVNILAFVLMTNHFHLIVKTPRANLQEFMRHFNISYTSSFNKRHNRTGHLYQGRYKAFLIDADAYLLEVFRYLHLNPVRVEGKTSLSPKEKKAYLRTYSWSSHIDYISESNQYPFLSKGEVLSHFDGKRQRCTAFVEEGMDLILNPLERGKGLGIIGDPSFVEAVAGHGVLSRKREQPATRRIIQRLEPERILRTVAETFSVTPGEFLKKGYTGIERGVAMEMLYRYGGMNQREIGELMGIDYSSVSVARKRLRDLLETDRNMAQQVDNIRERLSQT